MIFQLMMRTTTLAFSLAVGLLTQPAQADVYDHFISSLAGIPATVFSGKETANYVNLQAIAAISAKAEIPLASTQRGGLGLEWPIYQLLVKATPEVVQEQTGLSPDPFHFFTAFGARPQQTLVWGLEPAASKQLISALPQLGFSAYGTAKDQWSNGPLGQMNLSAAGSQSPWLWPTGEASLVFASDALLYQSQTEAALQATLQQPSALDSVTGQTLQQIYGHGPDFITQAIFFSKEIGKAAGGTAADGQPAYLGAMLADMEAEGSAKAVLAFAYADCPQALKGRDILKAQWQAPTPSQPEFAIVESTAGCLATVTVKDPQPTVAGNAAFMALFSALMMRHLPAIAE